MHQLQASSVDLHSSVPHYFSITFMYHPAPTMPTMLGDGGVPGGLVPPGGSGILSGSGASGNPGGSRRRAVPQEGPPRDCHGLGGITA